MTHDVVINDESQYSTWPTGRDLPAGWKPEGFQGSEAECLDHIEKVWTDLTPASVRARPEAAHPATNILTSARLILRELTVAQVAALLDPDARSDEWAEGYPMPGSRNAATGFGRRGPDDLRFGFGMYHLVRAADGLVIGEMGFHQPPSAGSTEVGFGVIESVRGHGYAGEALAELSRWAFSQVGVDEIVARTLADNTPARNLLSRLGFAHTGQDGDFERYVLGAAGLPPAARSFALDEAGQATITEVSAARLPGGLPHDLTFVPGTQPLLSAISQDGRPQAFVQCGALEGVDDEDNHFLHIVVHPEAGRRGLGTRLLSQARLFARAEGKSGLIAATADEDTISNAWMRKHGFTVVGIHGVNQFTPGSAPTATETPAGLTVEQVNPADAAAVDELLDLAVATFGEAELPGGVKLTSDRPSISQYLFPGNASDAESFLLVARRDGRPVGWLATEPVQDGDVSFLGCQVLAEQAGTGVAQALLEALAVWARQEKRTVNAVVEEKGQAEVAAALPGAGFTRQGGRSIWHLDISPAARN